MHAIAPHHSDEYDDVNFPLNNCDLYDDPWYKNDDKIDNYHQVWHCWRDGKLDDDTKLPDLLYITLVNCPWLDNFRDEMNKFFESDPNIDKYSKKEVISYLDWIDYWKQKNAKFYLSM